MVAALFIPSRNERWPLVERLGRGGAGETWRVLRQSAHFRDEVCVKVPISAVDADERAAILAEAHVLSRVRHANVVTLLDLVEDSAHRPLLVLELVRGTDLGIARKIPGCDALPAPALAAVGRSVALALGALGRAFPRGAAHRDVSPHNILVSREGEVKLADFGIARAHGSERRTKTGRLRGKCGYIAPERLCGEAGDEASDVFSLGVVLYELASRALPFSGKSLLEQLDSVLYGAPPPLAHRAPDLPRALAQVIDATLARDPKERPSPDELVRALAPWAGEASALDVLRELARRARGPGLARAVSRAADRGSSEPLFAHRALDASERPSRRFGGAPATG